MQRCITKKPTAIDARPAQLRWVEDHRNVWGHVLPGLRELRALDVGDWSIEGIEEMLREGEAFLVVDQDDMTGFMVLCVSAYKDATALLIYAAWHQSGNAMLRFQPQLERLARNAGIKWLRFYSRRPGMQRHAPRFGYRPQAIEYLKEL